MFELRPYQSNATDAALSFMRGSIDPIIIDAAPAAGKSFMIAKLANELHNMSGGKRVLCLAPSAELVKQNHAKYLLTGEYASIYSASAGAKSTRHVVVFGTPKTVANAISRFKRSGKEGYCAVIIDECFTGDTMVETPRGEVPIKSLRNGDTVCNAMGSGEVVTTFAKSVSELYEVKLSNGKVIRCTGNHPFFTGRGWIGAKALMEGEVAFSRQDMSRLHEGVWAIHDTPEGAELPKSRTRGQLDKAGNLLAILREEVEEPHALRGITSENGCNAISDRPQADDEGREWSRPNGAAVGADERAGRRMGTGEFRPNENWAQKRGLSEPLQDRHRQPITDDSNRSRRIKSSEPCPAGTGPAEDGTPNQVRVESVSRFELGSPETVYNLHVSGHPSYYAGGVLVHNCHGITPTIKAIIDEMRKANPNLRVIGLSGTPFRLGTGYVYRIGPNGRSNGDDTCRDPYFTKCVYRVSAQEMLEECFITPMIVDATGAENYDTSNIRLLANGDPNPDDIERAFVGHGRKTAAIVADVLERARPHKGGVMFFAATVRHAEEIMASLPPENSAIVTGNECRMMGQSATRKATIDAYRAQTFRYLVSVGTLTTGFDVEHTVGIALLRYTESSALLQQILGRAWRLHPDKPGGYLWDYAGNVERHFPDGDIYNPEIKASKGGGDSIKIEAACPDCSYVNEFSLNPDYADYQRDVHGYCLDVFGEQLSSEWGPIAAHYGQRCQNFLQTGDRGEFTQCGHYWTHKECEACGTANGISARYCRECRGELIDPNEKLVAEFKAMKKDPTMPQTDVVISCDVREGFSQRGNRTVRVDWVTPYRQFSVWLMPDSQGSRAMADWLKWQEASDLGKIETISYRKEADSGFYRILAYNRPADDSELPDHLASSKDIEKLRKYAA